MYRYSVFFGVKPRRAVLQPDKSYPGPDPDVARAVFVHRIDPRLWRNVEGAVTQPDRVGESVRPGLADLPDRGAAARKTEDFAQARLIWRVRDEPLVQEAPEPPPCSDQQIAAVVFINRVNVVAPQT